MVPVAGAVRFLTAAVAAGVPMEARCLATNSAGASLVSSAETPPAAIQQSVVVMPEMKRRCRNVLTDDLRS